jgi:hypothetical protein
LERDCPGSRENLDRPGYPDPQHPGHCDQHHRPCDWENQSVNQTAHRQDVIHLHHYRRKDDRHGTADDLNRPNHPKSPNHPGLVMNQKVYGDRVRSLAQHRFF